MTELLDWVAWAESGAAAAGRGIHVADRDDWTFWSYARLAELTRTTAAGLRSRGVEFGDVVVIVARSGPGFVATFFGALLAGATPSPVTPRAPFRSADNYDEHLAALLRLARPAAVVTEADLIDRLRPVVAAAVGRPCHSVDELRSGAPDDVLTASEAKPPALLQFTSGSSGNPRGIRIPHEALAANIAAVRDWLGWQPADGCASWLPVHHDMGLIGCLLTPVVTGADLWLMQPEQFITRPERYLRCFGPGGARFTAMPGFGVTHLLRRVRRGQLGDLDLSGWRAAVIGAERIDPAVLDEFELALAPLGLRIGTLLPAYGLAEATLAVTGVRPGRARREITVDPATLTLGDQVRESEPPEHGSRIAGCGAALDGLHVRVVDEQGGELPDRHVGEIVVHGRSVAGGYVSSDVSTASTTRLDNGTLSTGDAGFLDHSELFVIGRLGDALKVRGRLVYAEDLEATLAAAGLPLRRLAVALGTHRGRPTAVAVLEEPTPEGCETSLRLLRAAADGADIVVVSAESGSVARTSSGKPRRRAMWKWFQEHAAATETGPAIPANGLADSRIRVDSALASVKWKSDQKPTSEPPSGSS